MDREERRREWERRVERWRESGLSQKEFCQIHRLKWCTFHYWKKKLVKNDGPQVEWIGVEKPATLEPGQYELSLGRAQLSIPAHFNVDQLRSLVKVLLEEC